MKSLQEIRIDVVRLGKEIRVSQSFEFQFNKLQEFLKSQFKCQDFKLEDYELDKINNDRFECDILKAAICKAFGISLYSCSGNPWFECFNVLKVETPAGYHGSAAGKLEISYDLKFSDIVSYNIYNLLSITTDQIEFIRVFKEKYPRFRENLNLIKERCFPIIVEE